MLDAGKIPLSASSASSVSVPYARSLWQKCLELLRNKIPQNLFIQWISPLQAEFNGAEIILFAPNQYVVDGVVRDYLELIEKTFLALYPVKNAKISVIIGRQDLKINNLNQVKKSSSGHPSGWGANSINENFNFDNFVEGASNHLAKAAARQVAERPGYVFNPLLLYGGVGLGKTHLMHAVGNLMMQRSGAGPARVLYMHAERFVSEVVNTLNKNSMGELKRFFRRSLDVLLVDDIQFFSEKERSQEEFFYTFNALIESRKQIILTSDRFPKEIKGIEERLQSRFGSGLTIAVEPPEYDTRVAILHKKAEQFGIDLNDDVAFFIAKRVKSNVRELEGALKLVIANAHLTGSVISLDFARNALKDLISHQDRQVSLENIIQTVADYYKVKIKDILSKTRSRSIVRPRQIAMAVCKQLTSHSLPEIGDAFGGRDHTTVLHACRKIGELCNETKELSEDWKHLLRTLT